MDYFLCTVGCACGALGTVCMKQYSLKTARIRNGSYTFNFVLGLIALGFYAVSGALTDGLSADASVIPYAILYGAGYVLGTVGYLHAMQTGPLLLTVIVCQMGMLLPILYSFVFLHEMPKPTAIMGMILLFAALILFNSTGKMENDATPRKKPRLVYWMFLLFGCVGNGLATLAIKLQQYETPGKNGSALLFYGIGIATLSFLLMLLFLPPRTPDTHSVKDAVRTILPVSLFAAAYALCNATQNFLNTTVISRMPTVVFYMFGTGVGILMSFCVSRFVFRERLAVTQYTGCAIATIGLILLTAF